MTLTDHLREFRNRLFVSVLAVVAGTIVAWVFYGQISDVLLDPIIDVGKNLAAEQGIETQPVVNGVASSFLLQTKVSLVTGIVGSSPIWLYELWAFIMPGLHRNERRWTVIFVAVAGPLFFAGVALGYVVLPKGLSVLLGFTPDQVTSLIDLNDYLSFVIRVLLVFGVAFEIPLFVVMLNLAGVVKARQLARWRGWIIFLTFIFAAVATPSTDPITMLLLAFPMIVLFLISELIARVIDRRRGRDQDPDYAEFDDDEVSPI
ncbi:MAG: twin-arginine translocase subunit TatC [Nocardioidaceae bacterium]